MKEHDIESARDYLSLVSERASSSIEVSHALAASLHAENILVTTIATLHARFWSQVEKGGPEDCWIWKGAKNWKGYARFTIAGGKLTNGKIVPAYRFSYEQLRGPIPDGLEPDHTCENRICVNPAHVEIVTHAENIRRIHMRADFFKCGHPATGHNVFTYGTTGGKCCRECRYAKRHEWQARVKAQRGAA